MADPLDCLCANSPTGRQRIMQALSLTIATRREHMGLGCDGGSHSASGVKAMSEPKQLWSVTAGLYAIAAALLILAGALGNSLGAPRRYQFASSSMAGGQ